MTAREIIAALILRGVKRREIAKKLNVTDQMIHQVIYGRSTSRRVQAYIARLIGEDVDVIWPRGEVA